MKIAFISIVRDPWGGSEELWAAAAKIALDTGHQVYISALDRNDLSNRFRDLEKQGAELFLRRGYIKPGTKTYVRILKKILIFILNKISNPYNQLFRSGPDIVVYSASCYSVIDDVELINCLNKHKTPYLINNQVNIEYSKPINSLQANIIRAFYKQATKVCFVSERNLNIARRHLLDKIENSLIVRNPVNLTDTSIVSYPEETLTIRFAMVANLLVNHKGHDILFDVLRDKKWLERNWILNVYGSGNDESYIRDLISFFGLNQRIVLRGRTDDIRKVWQEHHILLMPSLCEGIPLAVVEAMICARPIVATDTGGHMEWIDDNVTGFIAGGANVNSFNEALERAWSRKNEWRKIGELARASALKKYDPTPGKSFLNLILDYGRRS